MTGSRSAGIRTPARVALDAVGLLLLSAVGVGLTIAADSPHGVVAGVACAALSAVGLVSLVLEARLRRGGVAAQLGTTPAGATATVIPRAHWHLPCLAGALAVLAAWPAASALIALTDEQWALAVVLVGIAAVPASFFPPLLTGRVSSGGLYLTPDTLLHVHHGGWWSTPWDAIAGVVPSHPLVIALTVGAAPECGRRTAHPGWTGMRSRGGNAPVIDTRFLPLDDARVAAVITGCADEFGVRGTLGTRESLAWQPLRSP